MSVCWCQSWLHQTGQIVLCYPFTRWQYWSVVSYLRCKLSWALPVRVCVRGRARVSEFHPLHRSWECTIFQDKQWSEFNQFLVCFWKWEFSFPWVMLASTCAVTHTCTYTGYRTCPHSYSRLHRYNSALTWLYCNSTNYLNFSRYYV